MNRRRFLRLTSLGTATASLPAFLAFSRTEGEDGGEGAGPLFPAGLRGELEKARAGGKPLLVLVIPRASKQKWRRGDVFGSFLNHATSDVMADLALAHVVCATASDVREALGEGAPAAAPLMVLVETDGEFVGRAIDPELPEVKEFDWSMDLSYEEQLERIDGAYRARNRALAAVLRESLVGGERLEKRAGQCVAVLSAGDVERLKEASDVAALDVGLVDRAAAWLKQEAEDADPARRDAIEAALTAAAVARLREVPPPGARWATSTGCGTEIEGEEEDEEALMIACGMGFVPDLGRRFLHFFSDH